MITTHLGKENTFMQEELLEIINSIEDEDVLRYVYAMLKDLVSRSHRDEKIVD